MTIATEYNEKWLQQRPQPMYDKTINRHFKEIFYDSPSDDKDLVSSFKTEMVDWLARHHLNDVRGLDAFPHHDIIIGCTQFIDDLYQIYRERVRVIEGDYTYHWRLNPSLIPVTPETIEHGDHIVVAMPFPRTGGVHASTGELLDKAAIKGAFVHIDGAWLTACRGIDFDFDHPAVASVGISLSKGLGLGANRIGLRFARQRSVGPVTIMNDFNMNCQSLLAVGRSFMRRFPPHYFWTRYEAAYMKVCRDFFLEPTPAIHLALREGEPVGIRPLLRFLEDER